MFESGWKGLIRPALFEQANPVYTRGSTTIPAASIWTGSRLWTAEFRRRNLHGGDLIAVALPAGPVFAQVAVAALWEGLHVAVVPGCSDASLPEDARLIVCAHTDVDRGVEVCTPLGVSGPSAHRLVGNSAIRPSQLPATPTVESRVWFCEDGLWVGYGDEELFAALACSLAKEDNTSDVRQSGPGWDKFDSFVNGFLMSLVGQGNHIVCIVDESADRFAA
jgi:hypothetical protein